MTDCENCGKPLGPGDGLGCVRCMGASMYVATIEQRRELVRKANRERQSPKERMPDSKGSRRSGIGRNDAVKTSAVHADDDGAQRERVEGRA